MTLLGPRSCSNLLIYLDAINNESRVCVCSLAAVDYALLLPRVWCTLPTYTIHSRYSHYHHSSSNPPVSCPSLLAGASHHQARRHFFCKTQQPLYLVLRIYVYRLSTGRKKSVLFCPTDPRTDVVGSYFFSHERMHPPSVSNHRWCTTEKKNGWDPDNTE